MRMRRAITALVGAASVALAVAAIGLAASPRPARRAVSVVAATSTSGGPPTTCLPVAIRVPPPTGRVVTDGNGGPIDVTEVDNGTQYNVPVGTIFNIRLTAITVVPGSCVPGTWDAIDARPGAVLRSPDGSDETIGQVATATFDAVGAGTGTISAELQVCGSNCGSGPWSVTVVVAAPAPAPTAPPNLPRTG